MPRVLAAIDCSLTRKGDLAWAMVWLALLLAGGAGWRRKLYVPDSIGPERKQDGFRYLLRHYVRLGWWDRTPGRTADENRGQGRPGSASGFIVSVAGEWYWITAGHVLKDIETALEKGQVLANMYLDVTSGLYARDKETITFRHEPERTFSMYHEELGIDFGLIALSPYYRDLLRASGIAPIHEDECCDIDMPCDFYAIVGTPEAFVEQTDALDTILKGDVHIPVTRIAECPPEMRKECPRFYGVILRTLCDERGELRDIKGVSGGPIFGFRTGTDGQLRYWVVAIQSAWHKPTRCIAGFPMTALVRLIDTVLAEHAQILAAVDPQI